MLNFRFSLFTKIITWFFLNLLVLGVILFFFFSYNFRFRPNSGFSGLFTSNIESVARQITNETDDKTRAERNEIIQRYNKKYEGVDFYLFDHQGRQLGGQEINLPPKVFEEITRPENFPLPPSKRPDRETRPERLPPPPPSIYLQTSDPTLYWFEAKAMTTEKGETKPIRTRLLASSDSFYGYGLFFNPLPWLILTSVIIFVSLIFWFPFVRSITRSIGQITTASKHIADENFEVRVSEKRSDELGVLGQSINHLAQRLEGFVKGQRRFLGDVSHELNSPLARSQVALSILEERVDKQNLPYVNDVKEEIELISKLVAELLTYSKAGIKSPHVKLENIHLRPLIENVIEREKVKEGADIEVTVDENLKVLAQPELLSRAFANVIRNAVRYAGEAGTISISAENIEANQVKITIADKGTGVPEDSLDKLFDPFYRIESDRGRKTGGTGLGLAIVKTCIEACNGKVFAQNLDSNGFAVNISLYKH